MARTAKFLLIRMSTSQKPDVTDFITVMLTLYINIRCKFYTKGRDRKQILDFKISRHLSMCAEYKALLFSLMIVRVPSSYKRSTISGSQPVISQSSAHGQDTGEGPWPCVAACTDPEQCSLSNGGRD